jgi:hypothetical protein
MAPETTILDTLRDGRAAAQNMRRLLDHGTLTEYLAIYYLRRIDTAFERILGAPDALAPEPFTVIDGGRR